MKDGILIVNKPQWYTSFDVVAKCRKILGTKKIGHTGTLDPMATGVLVLCVGKATALVNQLTTEEKVYRTTIKLGIETDTGDLAGKIRGREEYQLIKEEHLSDVSKQIFENNLEYIKNKNNVFDISIQKIEDVLNSFVGKQNQVPPMYSSIKINGKKLYEYARNGECVEVPSREIEIFAIYDIQFDGKDELSYSVHCSKGTYIRKLNEDIAKKLGTIGTTKVLERIKTGKYSIEDAIGIDNISDKSIISIENIFDNKIVLEKINEKKLINGIKIDVSNEDGIYNIYIDDKYYGLGEVADNKLKRFIII